MNHLGHLNVRLLFNVAHDKLINELIPRQLLQTFLPSERPLYIFQEITSSNTECFVKTVLFATCQQ